MKKKPKHLPAICRVLGIGLIVVVIALCAPITLPRIAGYEIYNVVSGSMEPEMPVGSVLYVKPTGLESVAEGEGIAYQDVDAVIAHRVVYNRPALGEFVTKGDANNMEDRKPVPYDAVIGRVEQHIPVFGMAMDIYASAIGKVYLLLTAGCGLMLCMIATSMEERNAANAA
jgi:signal peptidase I